MRVNIHTKVLGDTDFESTRKDIRWNNSSDRRWLMNHLHHCMMNNKVVTLTPMESN